MHGFDQTSLAPVIVDDAIPDMTHGAHGEEDPNGRVEAGEFHQGATQCINDLVDGHQMFGKGLRRRAVTIGDGLAGSGQTIREGAAERNDKPSCLSQEGMCTGLRGIDLFEAGRPVGMRKLTVMLPALPEFVKTDQVFGPITPVMDIRKQAAGHAGWIEEDAVRILERTEFQFLQAVPDMLGKARTDEQDRVLIGDQGYRRIDAYGELKFHVVVFRVGAEAPPS